MNEKSPYGKGVRAQVFEVIVRQGMKGAPWREICIGPMQVNNITPEEVEAEIRRRGGSLEGPTAPPVPKRPNSPAGSGGATLNLPPTVRAQLSVVTDLVSFLLKENDSADGDLQHKLKRLQAEIETLSDLMIGEELTKNNADSETQLQIDLERENHRTRQEIKPANETPPHTL